MIEVYAKNNWSTLRSLPIGRTNNNLYDNWIICEFAFFRFIISLVEKSCLRLMSINMLLIDTSYSNDMSYCKALNFVF